MDWEVGMGEAVLALNAGSSSFKFAVFGLGRELPLLVRGKVEGVDGAPRLSAKDAVGAALEGRPEEGDGVFGWLLRWVEGHLGGRRLVGVGHRVVHGGRDFAAPVRVSGAVLEALEELTPLAPLHQPHCLAPMRAVLEAAPGLEQVACFDTAFHRSMSDVAARLALPWTYWEEGVRRYGFHGLSYEFIAGRLREVAPGLASGRVIVAHLGSGASLCAMREGRSVDTTMGFSALDGLVMGTRCGTLDPGVVLYMMQNKGLSAGEVERVLYHESGLLGLSGVSGDMRVVAERGEGRARAAVESFVFRVAREVGGLVSSLGGLDGLVFTGGIGEHDAVVRAGVCARLEWLGVTVDDGANGASAKTGGEGRIGGGGVEVWVVPTDEERVIAGHVADVLGVG